MPSAPFYSNVFLPRGPSSLLLKKTKKITFLITFYQRGDLATTERETKLSEETPFSAANIRVSSDSIKTKTFFESSFNMHLSTIKQITILLICNVIQSISYIAYCLNFFERKNISKQRNSETVGSRGTCRIFHIYWTSWLDTLFTRNHPIFLLRSHGTFKS